MPYDACAHRLLSTAADAQCGPNSGRDSDDDSDRPVHFDANRVFVAEPLDASDSPAHRLSSPDADDVAVLPHVRAAAVAPHSRSAARAAGLRV